jgi:hypothetical protein
LSAAAQFSSSEHKSAKRRPLFFAPGPRSILFRAPPLLALALLLQQRQVLLLAPLTLGDALELHREYVSGD